MNLTILQQNLCNLLKIILFSFLFCCSKVATAAPVESSSYLLADETTYSLTDNTNKIGKVVRKRSFITFERSIATSNFASSNYSASYGQKSLSTHDPIKLTWSAVSYTDVPAKLFSEVTQRYNTSQNISFYDGPIVENMIGLDGSSQIKQRLDINIKDQQASTFIKEPRIIALFAMGLLLMWGLKPPSSRGFKREQRKD